MKEFRKKFLVIVLLVIFIFAQTVNAAGTTVDVFNAEDGAWELAQNFILLPANDGLSGWSSETEVLSEIKLYSPTGELNGIIYDLMTDGKATGYIEISISNNEPAIKAYSYDGTNAVAGLLSCSEYELDIYADNVEIISLGGLNYFVCSDEKQGQVLSLYSGEYTDYNETDFQNYYEGVCSAVENSAVCSYEALCEDVTLTSTGSASCDEYTTLDLVEMDDYSGYANHCAPTAGTNIIKYFDEVKGVNMYYDDTDTFGWLYEFMGTTDNGTERTNILKGLKLYFSYYGISYDFSGTTTSSTSLSTVRTYLAKDCPVQISVDNFEGVSTGHSIVAFACGLTAVTVATGWDTSFHTYTYSSLDVARLAYIGFSF